MEIRVANLVGPPRGEPLPRLAGRHALGRVVPEDDAVLHAEGVPQLCPEPGSAHDVQRLSQYVCLWVRLERILDLETIHAQRDALLDFPCVRLKKKQVSIFYISYFVVEEGSIT